MTTFTYRKRQWPPPKSAEHYGPTHAIRAMSGADRVMGSSSSLVTPENNAQAGPSRARVSEQPDREAPQAQTVMSPIKRANAVRPRPSSSPRSPQSFKAAAAVPPSSSLTPLSSTAGSVDRKAGPATSSYSPSSSSPFKFPIVDPLTSEDEADAPSPIPKRFVLSDEDDFNSSDEDAPKSTAARKRTARHASVSDSDDGTLGDLTINVAQRWRPRSDSSPNRSPAKSSQPRKRASKDSTAELESPSPSKFSAVSAVDAEAAAESSSRRPKRAAALQVTKYRFRPSLIKPSQPKVQRSAVEQANLKLPTANDKSKIRFTLDYLLKEKQRQQKRRAELGLLEMTAEQLKDIGERAQAPIEETEDQAMSRLRQEMDADYMARAVEGLQDSSDEEASRGSRVAKPESDSDDSINHELNPLHELWNDSEAEAASLTGDEGGGSSPGAGPPTTKSRDFDPTLVLKSLRNEDGANSEEEEGDRMLMDILARDRALLKQHAAGQDAQRARQSHKAKEAGAFRFWRMSRVPDPQWVMRDVKNLLASQHRLLVALGEATQSADEQKIQAYLCSGALEALIGNAALTQNESSNLMLCLIQWAILRTGAVATTARALAIRVASKTTAHNSGGPTWEDLLLEVLVILGCTEEVGRLLNPSPKSRIELPTAYGPRNTIPEDITLLTPRRRAEIVHNLLMTMPAILSAKSSGQALQFIIHSVALLSLDETSYGPATLQDFRSVIESALEQVPWNQDCTEGEPLTGLLRTLAQRKPCSRRVLLKAVKCWPEGTPKSRHIKRCSALSLCFQNENTEATEDRLTLKKICASLDSDDPKLNPLYIPPRALDNADEPLDDLGINVQLLSIGLSDLTLFLAEPRGSFAPREKATEFHPSSPHSGEGSKQFDDAVMSLSPPQSAGSKSDDAEVFQDALTTSDAVDGTNNVGAAAAVPSRSRAGLLRRNRAFRLAAAEYEEACPSALLVHLCAGAWLHRRGKESTGMSNDVVKQIHSSQESQQLFPTRNRLCQLHRLIALLRTLHTRMSSSRPMVMGMDLALASSSSASDPYGRGGRGAVESPSFRKFKIKDDLQRLGYRLSYASEMLTGVRQGDEENSTLADDDDDEADDCEMQLQMRLQTRDDLPFAVDAKRERPIVPSLAPTKGDVSVRPRPKPRPTALSPTASDPPTVAAPPSEPMTSSTPRPVSGADEPPESLASPASLLQTAAAQTQTETKAKSKPTPMGKGSRRSDASQRKLADFFSSSSTTRKRET